MAPKPFRKGYWKANGNVGWVVVKSVVAVVLLVATAFKTHQLATVPFLGDGLFEARWFQILLVECELALAVVLFAGIAPKITWLISMILFSAFTIVSLAKGLSGSESCGCMDVGIVASLIVFRPTIAVFHWKVFKREFYRAWQSKRVIAVVVVYLVLAVPATYAMMSVNDYAVLDGQFFCFFDCLVLSTL